MDLMVSEVQRAIKVYLVFPEKMVLGDSLEKEEPLVKVVHLAPRANL